MTWPNRIKPAQSDSLPWHHRLNIRLLLWLWLAALVPVLISGWLGSRAIERALLGTVLRDPPLETRLFGQEIEEVIGTVTEVVGELAAVDAIVDWSSSSKPPLSQPEETESSETPMAAEILSQAAEQLFSENEFAVLTRLRLIDLSGRETLKLEMDEGGEITMYAERELSSLADQNFFKRALEAGEGEIIISPVELDPEKDVDPRLEPNSSVMHVSQAVIDSSGRRAGILTADFNPEFLFREFYPDGLNFGPVNQSGFDELSFLTDARGNFLSYRDLTKRWGGTDGLNTGASLRTEFPEVAKSIFDRDFTAEVQRELAELPEREAATESQVATPGIIRLLPHWAVHYRPIFPNPDDPENFWVAIYIVPGQLVHTPITNLQSQIILTTVALMTLIVVGAFQISRSISRPVVELERGAEIIQGGNLNHRVKISGRDEIARLGLAFNRMTQRLKESYSNLEAKVQQRTQELRRFQQAVQSATDGIMMLTPAGEIVFVNPAWETQTGHDRADVLGRDLGFMLDTKSAPKTVQKLQESLARGQAFTTENLLFHRKSGAPYEVQLSLAPIKERSRTIFFIAIQQDISKRKEIDRAKTEFVSLASHQLRTPLSTINWYTEMLLAGDAGNLTSKQRNYLKQIYGGNQRLVKLVGDLLNVSRLELGTFVVEPSLTDIRPLIEDTLSDVAALTKLNRLKIIKRYDPRLKSAMVDPNLMRLIIQNLVSNAVKYTPPEGQVTVEVSFAKAKQILEGQTMTEDGLVLKVADTGYGIPRHQQDKIFTKLFRADNARAKVSEGTGLGLYMVKSIVDHSRGRIWFRSTENQGTTFVVAIPLKGMPAKSGTKPLSI